MTEQDKDRLLFAKWITWNEWNYSSVMKVWYQKVRKETVIATDIELLQKYEEYLKQR